MSKPKATPVSSIGGHDLPTLANLRFIEHLKVVATDGDVGSVVGFLLDDERWLVRYMVVETGGFVGGRKLLVSPISLVPSRRSNRGLAVALTIGKIQHSPNIDSGKPVSRTQERDLCRYYGYSRYWGYSGVWGAGGHPAALGAGPKGDGSVDHLADESSDVHLRTDADLRGFHVIGSDDTIGHVSDVIIDQDTWEIHYLVVDTESWCSKREVLLSPRWAASRSWDARTIHLDLSREAIQLSPDWNRAAAIDRAYEARLCAHYQRPGHWELGSAGQVTPG